MAHTPVTGEDRGANLPGPVTSEFRIQGQRTSHRDELFRCNPFSRIDDYEDFDRALETFSLEGAMFTDAGAANDIVVTAATVSDASFMVPRAGFLQSVQLIAEDALALSDTNFLTFSLINNGNSGAGTTEMLSVTADTHTTKTTGPGIAITAETGRPFTVSATAASLRVAAGDLLTFKSTVTGTLVNAVNKPKVRLIFATLPDGVVPRTTKTVGLLAAQPVANAANGTALFQLGSTAEANVTGFDRGDQLTLPAHIRAATTGKGSGPIFNVRLKVSGVAAATRMVWGFASAYNATFDSVVTHAWFRLEGASLALLAETDDGTTDNDDQATGITLVADTYNLFTINMRDPSKIGFYVNKNRVLELSAAALVNTMVLQPVVWLQKDSGTGTESITVDEYRARCNRLL